MKRLMAEIKRQLTKRVWNAMDRWEAMKWRTFMPAEAPRRPSRIEMPQIMVRSRELTGDKLDVI